MNLEDIKGIGKVKKKLLNKLSIYSVEDLLYAKPRSYEDRRNFISLQKAVNKNDDNASLVKVKVINHTYLRGVKNKTLKIIVSDDTLNASLVCFNQSYLEKSYPIGEELIVFGKFQFRFDEAQSTNFEILKNIDLNSSFEFGRIVPIYNLTEGLHQKFMRSIIYYTLSTMLKNITNYLPKHIIHKRKLLNLKDALWELHFPSDYDKIIPAIKRLKYKELFYLQFNLQMKKYKNLINSKEPFTKADLSRKIIKELNFKLTNGQKLALKDIKEDLFSSIPMNRLLQGDVGSGKTLVGIITMTLAYENNYVSAFMVPTEVLALQHFQIIKKILLPYNINIGILYSSMPSKDKTITLQKLKEGKINIVIGTHSLFSENVEYKNLGLVIIDEQHKFGVRQRISLLQKSNNVNVLVMTATPIPRTLTHTIYSDMEVSFIKDKPINRKKIKTKVLYLDERKKVYDFIREQVNNNKQAYIIYPIIEESNKLNLAPAKEMYELLSQEEFSNLEIGLLHGRMDTEQKQEIMNKFTNNEIKILISTTVVEVGIDNPNATIMLIEHGERFGLSQLHQLRGRIGRGDVLSYCFILVNRNITEEGKKRMRAMVKYDSGFDIAEKDLEIRGPGQFLGYKQSGISDFKFADLTKDYDIVKECMQDCKEIIQKDPNLKEKEHQKLKLLLEKFETENKYLIQN